MAVLLKYESLNFSQNRAVEQAMRTEILGEGAIPAKVSECELGMGCQSQAVRFIVNRCDSENTEGVRSADCRPEINDELQ